MKKLLCFLMLLGFLFPTSTAKQQEYAEVSFDGLTYTQYTVFPEFSKNSTDESFLEYFYKKTEQGVEPFAVLFSYCPRLSGDIQLYATQNDIPAVEAKLVFNKDDPTCPFSFTQEKTGKRLNPYKTVEDIFKKLDNSRKIVIFPVFDEVRPVMTVEKLKNDTVALASFTTSYKTSCPNRCKNIETAASRINGTVLIPGQVFSFNDVTLRRTEENGYFPATVINNGEYVEGIGGGVCQVSTTLYNAVKKANLEVVKRYVHTIPPSYVSPGNDATVSDNMDFCFENDTESFLYVVCYTRNKTITVDLYGKAK